MTSQDKIMTFRNSALDSQKSGSVSVAFVVAFIDFCVQHGANLTTMLAECGLDAAQLRASDERFSIDDFYKIILVCKKLTHDPGIVVKFASHADFSEVSVAGLIANASPTMLDALNQLNRYSRLTIDSPHKGESSLLFERGDVDDFIIDQRLPSLAHADLIDISFTYLITGPRTFLPREHVLQVQRTCAAPTHATVLENIWKCPIEFNAPRNAIRLPKWVADYPVRQQPDYVFAILSAHAESLLISDAMRLGFSETLERLIMSELHTGEVNLEWVSSRLNLSRQTIYRRLKAEGTTFEALFDRLRHRMATVYLVERNTSVLETAFLLGYSDPSPFSRAFKRWTGQSPAAYGKKNRV